MKTLRIQICLIGLLAGGASAQSWNHDPASSSGPLHWGEVAPQYATCGNTVSGRLVEVGMKQTAVNIESAKAVEAILPDLAFRYRSTPLEVENTGHVIEVPYKSGSALRIGRSLTDEYEILQFHFHAPSEHTVDGKSFDAELHLVHKNRIGELAVVGVLLTKSSEHPLEIFDDIMNNAPMKSGDSHEEESSVNARIMLPGNRAFYTYTGSLTTPPCTEGVRWFVFTNPVGISEHAVEQLHTLVGMFPGYNGFKNNNRPVAPLNGRTILSAH